MLLLVGVAFVSHGYIDIQRHQHVSNRVQQLNQTHVHIFDELKHQRERRQTLSGRVLFLESDLEDVLGPNWTYVDGSDNISFTQCERVSRMEVECRVEPKIVRNAEDGDSS